MMKRRPLPSYDCRQMIHKLIKSKHFTGLSPPEDERLIELGAKEASEQLPGITDDSGFNLFLERTMGSLLKALKPEKENAYE